MNDCKCDNTKIVSVKEYDAVITAAKYYVDGLKSGDADLVAKAFHMGSVPRGSILQSSNSQSFIPMQSENLA